MAKVTLAEKQRACRLNQEGERHRTKEEKARALDELIYEMQVARAAKKAKREEAAREREAKLALARSVIRPPSRAAKKAYVLMYRQTHPCVDCGEADPVVLDFDHREPEMKVDCISRMTNNATLDALATEIGKCDVRCSNCHRRKHHRERVAAL